ncbi:epidermal growth factor receptor substrate 15-like 1 isoform X3 [Oryzias latipes]|uniref:epidermal growth factor receptor substrate 15-like 1 isoform X3 n=1 Tax=Oryzias latipes TaxID=8090 RepID=UPI000CE276AC|nr:epidermal growth factor receptor substrate 15-like 1 isoform X3 [Oryzias latipes]
MAELLSVSQMSNGNAAYELYYRQLDPGNTGKISAAEAAQFLKKSGLPDSTLGKIWDLADSDRKGFLDKKGFFIALRLVASAQAGNDVSLSNLSQSAAVPKFSDTSSPLTRSSTLASDPQWAIRPDEKGKFEGIFESLSPVQGLLSGDKVRPVLINSKLPLDVLGKIWDLSDVDKDGHLDKEEFIVAMHLVYRAMEKEAVPASLPANLIPPSKRKKSAMALPGAVAVLPSLSGLLSSPVTLKETLLSSSPAPASASAAKLSPKPSFKSSSEPEVKWAVPAADRARYEDLFKKTDTDNDGLVTGGDVIEIFMQSTLSQTMLAQIWGLADTKHTGKLTREQFCLAMHLIHQKSTKGIDPPSSLTPDMIPPSERTESSMDLESLTGSLELTGVKDLDDLSKEIAHLQREKFILEHQIQESEEALVQKNGDVQSMQHDVEQESSGLQDLESQQRDARGRLQEMEQQRSKLDGMLHDVKHKCQEESQLIASMQSQIRSQEAELRTQEDELSRTKSELSRLQAEEAQLEQRLLSTRIQLETIVKSLKGTQGEISQARTKLTMIQENQREITKTIEEYNSALSSISSGNLGNLPDLSDGFMENGSLRAPVLQDDSFKARIAMFNSSAPKEPAADPFQIEDPFRSDLLKDPFGDDPFKESDPFKGASTEDFFKTDRSDLFGSADPFAKRPVPPLKPSAFSSSEPFSSTGPKPRDSDVFGKADPFRGKSFSGSSAGFADFSHMSKKPDAPGLTPKKSLPSRPAPPYVGLLGSIPAEPVPAVCSTALGWSSPAAASRGSPVASAGLGSFGSERQQLEWAKRDGEREERLRRLRLQEQQELELAIALSKADTLNA